MNDSYVDQPMLLYLCVERRNDRASFTFLCTLSFLNISVASRRCWFSKILQQWSTLLSVCIRLSPYFLALYASNGRLRIKATQYPLIKKSAVRKACTAASGTM
jgi:hypothetical protein